MADYVPGPDAAFAVFFKNIIQFVGGKYSGSTTPPVGTKQPPTKACDPREHV
ncbi:MAG: hypothetical protein LBK74_03500 [Treponema sp.]|jgi:hypothetical protein|nr:hypothetical protein [Treponema sp.]